MIFPCSKGSRSQTKVNEPLRQVPGCKRTMDYLQLKTITIFSKKSFGIIGSHTIENVRSFLRTGDRLQPMFFHINDPIGRIWLA